MKKVIIIFVVLLIVAAAVIGYLHNDFTGKMENLDKIYENVILTKNEITNVYQSDFPGIHNLPENTTLNEFVFNEIDNYFVSHKVLEYDIQELEPILLDTLSSIYSSQISYNITFSDTAGKALLIVEDFENSIVLSQFQDLSLRLNEDNPGLMDIKTKIDFYIPKYSPFSTDIIIERGEESETSGLAATIFGEAPPKPIVVKKKETTEVKPTAKKVVQTQPVSTKTVTHILKAGENLYRLSLRYGTTVQAIIEANGIKDVSDLPIGMKLLIPAGKITSKPAYTQPEKKKVTYTPPKVSKKALPETFYVSQLDGGQIAGIIYDPQSPVCFLSYYSETITLAHNDIWKNYKVIRIYKDKVLFEKLDTKDKYHLLFKK